MKAKKRLQKDIGEIIKEIKFHSGEGRGSYTLCNTCDGCIGCCDDDTGSSGGDSCKEK
ncbi:MAG: hypothetical protein KatS3mg095_0943 [Candidatus Parcubacteria bacterium]|nr:MAG: hypothetical protein KatS3mg095_0943 [Candidatus Parcubacteria bacterium]